MFRALFLVVSFVAFVSSSFSADQFHCPQSYCVAVVDAGSSGSRLHIYAYDKDNQGWPVKINESYSKKVSPGISSLENNPDAAEQYLTDLFQIQIDETVPVMFFATAGMRMLSVESQEKIYSHLRQWFDNQPAWQLQSMKTISGQEEGLFAWLAVNYEQGNFQDNSRELNGIMDMGGASVQIAMPVSGSSSTSNKNLLHFQLYNKDYQIFVKSFLGIGQNELARQFREEESCYSIDYPLVDNMTGKGDINRCRRQVGKLLNKIHYVRQEIQAAVQDSKIKHWSALGGLYYLVKAPEFENNSEQFTLEAVKNKADTAICQSNWSTLEQNDPDNSYLANYCLSSAYYYALVVDGYGINPQQQIQLDDSDWTLGALLYMRNL